jgi:hypothetical protein
MNESLLNLSTGHNRIALIACYFGKLPDYAPIVFHAMGMNRRVDWIFVADQSPEFDLPANVKLCIFSLNDIARRCSNVCDFDIKIDHPYHICSLRPAFGLCFQDELLGYSYWGHVDLDVIYGDVLNFIPDAILEGHDRILGRGHLSIYRNSKEVNSAFKLKAPGVIDYRSKFQNLSLFEPFDEWRGIWKILRYHRFRQYHDEFIADIKPPTRYRITRFEAEGLPNHPHQFFYWHQGKTFQSYYHREGGLFDREVAYIHFQKRNLPPPRFLINDTLGFSIGPSGFAPYNLDNLTPDEMDFINQGRPKPLGQIAHDTVIRIRKRFCKITASRR